MVLGYFLFGYIHPYFDGNGRMARLITGSLKATGHLLQMVELRMRLQLSLLDPDNTRFLNEAQ